MVMVDLKIRLLHLNHAVFNEVPSKCIPHVTVHLFPSPWTNHFYNMATYIKIHKLQTTPKKKRWCYTRVPRNAATLGAPKLGTGATLLPQRLQLPSSRCHHPKPTIHPIPRSNLSETENYMFKAIDTKKNGGNKIDVEWHKSYHTQIPLNFGKQSREKRFHGDTIVVFFWFQVRPTSACIHHAVGSSLPCLAQCAA